MDRFSKLESRHVNLLATLQGARPGEPADDFSEGVMQRVCVEKEARTVLESARPALTDPGNFVHSVMDRVADSIDAGRGADDEHHPPQLGHLRWLGYVGTAVAAGLIVAVLYSPLQTVLAPIPATRGTENPALVPTHPVPRPPQPLVAHVRFSRHYEGQQRWIVDAGLLEGVRVDNLLEYSRDGKVAAGRLRVVGVSLGYSICATEGGQGPQPRDLVAAESPTPAMYAARDALDRRLLVPGAFFGLGAIFVQRDDGLMVNELIGELWDPGWARPRHSPATRLGLRRGDRIQALFGERVRNEADLDRVQRAGRSDMPLVMTVIRDGKEVRLIEKRH